MYLINFQIFSDPGKIYVSGDISIVDILGALGMYGPGEVGLIDNMIVALIRKNGAMVGVIVANDFPNNQTPLGVYIFFNTKSSCSYINLLLPL